MILRDEFYFEPRVISEHGSIRWYGEQYSDQTMLFHTEETVYIRDNGEELYLYKLNSDEFSDVKRIKAEFTLICKIEKYNKGHRYGMKIGK